MNIFSVNIINKLLSVLLSIFYPSLLQDNNLKQEVIMVLDTSSILESDTEVFKYKEAFAVIVPSVVVSELLHISKRSVDLELQQNAQYALSELIYFAKKGEVIIPPPRSHKLDFKFNGIDANDRKILSRAIRYSNSGYAVCLVTQDRKLAAIAKSNNIQTKAYPFE